MDDVDENKIIVFPSDNTSAQPAGRDHILQQICSTWHGQLSMSLSKNNKNISDMLFLQKSDITPMSNVHISEVCQGNNKN